MELERAIYERRSIRKYTNKLIEKDTIEKIIEAGMWAPSACNVQGWKFIVLDDEKLIAKIVNMGAASFLKNVHQAVLVLYDNQTDNIEYNDYIQSASACIENMLLEAYNLNVGTCWVNNLPTKRKLRKLLNIPTQYSPIALVSMGYYNQEAHIMPRKYDVNKSIAYNTFRFECSKKNVFLLWVKRIARKIYKIMPFKKTMMRIAGKFEKKFEN